LCIQHSCPRGLRCAPAVQATPSVSHGMSDQLSFRQQLQRHLAEEPSIAQMLASGEGQEGGQPQAAQEQPQQQQGQASLPLSPRSSHQASHESGRGRGRGLLALVWLYHQGVCL
jgi:hypothetical protein